MIRLFIRLWPIIQPIVQPIVIAGAAAVVSFIATYNPEKSAQMAEKYLKGEAGAAGAAAKPGFPFFSVIVLTVLFTGLWWTRYHNPIVTLALGPEKTALGKAKQKANLPFSAWFDSKSALETQSAHLLAMEKHLGNAVSASRDLEKTQKRVKKIRDLGYSNGIVVCLTRAGVLASVGSIREVEKMLTKASDFKRKGKLKMDDEELNAVRRQAYSVRAEKLLGRAQAAGQAGELQKAASALTEIKELMKVGGLTITPEDVDNTLTSAKRTFLQGIIEDAKMEASTGSRVETRRLLDNARRYAKGEGLVLDDAEINEILNLVRL